MSSFNHSNISQFWISIPTMWKKVGLAAALLAVIGIELAVMATLWPDTLSAWWHADTTGDFPAFYRAAEELRPHGFYSPALSVLLYPLTFLSIPAAYRVYLALGAVSLAATAFLAQQAVRSPEARVAVVLGVLSIPQLHWALRLGHMTNMLVLAALGGFLLLRRHPILAGLCFAFLILKPQFALVPALYLVWTRNGKALAAMVLGAAALELGGFAITGFGAIGAYLSGFLNWGADARDNLIPHQQSWQYSWQGFLISMGRDPNPLIAFDLALVSLAVVALAWARTRESVALVAAALGMLLVTPFANFYDWGLLVVAGALLIRAQVPWKAAVPVTLAGLYALLLVSQQATPFPAVDIELAGFGPDGQALIAPISQTLGIYWITPAALVAVALLAAMGGRVRARALAEEGSPKKIRRIDPAAVASALRMQVAGALRPSRRLALAAFVLPAVFFMAAYIGGAPPFVRTYDPFSPSEVLRQLPADFPIPEGGKLQAAGEGDELPYHVEWTSDKPVSEVAGAYREMLSGDEWELMQEDDAGPGYRVRIAHFTPLGLMTHWAMLDVTNDGSSSRISLDFFATQKLTLALDRAESTE
ncbi:MAG: DUF2029 domain-containing protein [Chloroflexi bacterium]|nr:DUF2029 domain-containing protein [Chloroflexota bacterium]